MPADAPKVVVWFKAYAALFAALYLVVAVCSLVFFLLDPAELDMTRPEALITGAFLLTLGLVFCLAFAFPFFLKPRPWVWVYDLVLICIGLTSPCCMPASIPLLIYWLKPEAKAYFGRQ
jgi:hypothetical protein